MRALTAAEIAATEAIAAGFQEGLQKRGMTDMLACNRFAVEAVTRPDGLDVVVRENGTRDAMAGAQIGVISRFDSQSRAAFRATGDELAGRIERLKEAETLAGGPHMYRGQRIFEEHVRQAAKSTPFAAESIEQLEAEDFGVGNAALHVYATDSAIAKVGAEGAAALGAMQGKTLRQVIEGASKRVRAVLDVDKDGSLAFDKLKVK